MLPGGGESVGTSSLWVQAVSLSVFMAAGTWGLVRMLLIGLAGTRYFQMRASRYPESATWSRPRLLGRTPLLVASIACWPAAIVFALSRGFGMIADGPWIALLAAWPAAAAVLLVVDSRSPWAGLRRQLSAAANAKFDMRDGVLEQGFDEDPQINGTIAS
jgi:hypothetical protein